MPYVGLRPSCSPRGRALRALQSRPMPESRGRVELFPDHSPLAWVEGEVIEGHRSQIDSRGSPSSFRLLSFSNYGLSLALASVRGLCWISVEGSGDFAIVAGFRIRKLAEDVRVFVTHEVAAERGPKRANLQLARIADYKTLRKARPLCISPPEAIRILQQFSCCALCPFSQSRFKICGWVPLAAHQAALEASSECSESQDSQPLSPLAPPWASGRFETSASFTIFLDDIPQSRNH